MRILGTFTLARATIRLAGAMFVLSHMPPYAQAQWTVTNLSPANAQSSGALSVAGSQQVGNAIIDNNRRASLWNGVAASWSDLTPNGAFSATARGTSGTHQVGDAAFPGVGTHAGYWNGSADSWIDLHPAGARNSYGFDIFESQQVGYAEWGGGVVHAGLWNGTAASWTDLHPAGTESSVAVGTSGTEQVGTAIVGSASHASLWRGSAGSWVDLHPAGATSSQAYATSGTQQVGYANVAGHYRASLWNGTPESWVDLHPADAITSYAQDIFGTLQVGFADFTDARRAVLWNGSAQSWVDLHAFLPPEFVMSGASGVWSDGATIFVVGAGLNQTTDRFEALLWTRSIPEPSSVLLFGLCGLMTARRWKSAVGLNVMAVLLGSAAQAATYTVLPDRNFIALNEDGSIVLGVDEGCVFRWSQPNELEQIGCLPMEFYAIAVSADGTVLAGSGPGHCPARWVFSSGIECLGDLGLPGGTAYDLSADGSIIVGQSYNDYGFMRAFRWTSGTSMRDLDPDNQDYDSLCYAVSDSGAAATGYLSYPQGVEGTFQWTSHTGINFIGKPSNVDFLRPLGISNGGSVVYGHAYPTHRSYRWSPEQGWHDLGSLYEEEASQTFAMDMSTDGSVIVGYCGGTRDSRGFLYTATQGMMDLNTYLPLLGIDLRGRTITRAVSISGDGSAILAIANNHITNRSDTLLITGLPTYGDMNCDGLLNNFDIDSFVLALNDPVTYAELYPTCDLLKADINRDGTVNNLDIDGFVACLESSGCL